MAWRTRRFSPKPSRWALPPHACRPVPSIKSAPSISKNSSARNVPNSPPNLLHCRQSKSRSLRAAEEKIVVITAPPPEIKPPVEPEPPKVVVLAPPPVVEEPKHPPPPPKPTGPKVGDKIGFIQLPSRPQPRTGQKTGSAKRPRVLRGKARQNPNPFPVHLPDGHQFHRRVNRQGGTGQTCRRTGTQIRRAGNR